MILKWVLNLESRSSYQRITGKSTTKTNSNCSYELSVKEKCEGMMNISLSE